MIQIPTNLSGFVSGAIAPPRVLLIDPCVQDAQEIKRTITRMDEDPDAVTHMTTLSAALASDMDRYDLAISTMHTGDATGLEVLEELLLLRPDLPIIMLAADHSNVDAAQLMREGAYDYVVKAEGYLRSLPVIIEKNLALHQVKQENARLQIQLTATLGQLRTRNEQLQGVVKELEQIAATDSLTGIANRRAVTAALDQRHAHAVRQGSDLTLLAIDLDGFKHLNDTAGHPAGDRVLMLVARVLTANARASDVPGRIGGDEFVVILPETNTDEAVMVAKRIQADFDSGFADMAARIGYPGKVTISVGVSSQQAAGRNTSSSSDLLATADRALYRAKDAGRACIMIDGVTTPSDHNK